MMTFNRTATPVPVSSAQLAANRANAQLSTGPRTEIGKRLSSMNAVKTGLTGRTILLPSDDAPQYESHIRRFFSDFTPVGDRESELVQSLADTQWRLNRIPSLEIGIYALGRLEFGDDFSAHDPAEAALLLDSYIFIRRQKELRNLAIQESRLRRQYQKDSAELAALQKDRRERETKHNAASRSEHSAKVPDQSGLSANGFVFSTDRNASPETQHPGQCAPASMPTGGANLA